MSLPFQLALNVPFDILDPPPLLSTPSSASTSKISSLSPVGPSAPSSSLSPSMDLVDDFVLKIQGFMSHLQSTDPPVSEPSTDGYQKEVEDEMTLLCVRQFRDGAEMSVTLKGCPFLELDG